MKYVIFDIDGTLTDTTEVDDRCYIDAFQSMFEVSIEDIQWSQLKNVTDWGITEELVEIKFKRKVHKDEISKLKMLFLQNLLDEYAKDKSQFSEIDGARSFFNSLLVNSDFQIGIATGGWEESANLKLEAIGINPDHTSYSNSNHFKTRESITNDVLTQLHKISSNIPEEIIYLGDGIWDFKTCQNLGIRFIGIDSKKNNKLKEVGAKEVYTNFNNSNEIMSSIMDSIG